MVAIGIIAGCGIVISYLLVRLYRQKKEIYDFTEELQRCLTLVKAGEDIGNEAEFKDSLWDKIYQDLQELMDVWNRKNRQSHKEKEQIKELISDISHQGGCGSGTGSGSKRDFCPCGLPGDIETVLRCQVDTGSNF